MPLTIPQSSSADLKLVQKVKKIYQAGVTYKQAIDFYAKCAEYDRFYNADQCAGYGTDEEFSPAHHE